MKKIIITLITLFLLTSCTSKKEIDTIDDNYRVFYQIFVGSFSDSNNDGIGDIQGIINRLDYLNDGDVNSKDSLHVQGLWLSPIFTSPTYHKYDVTDYYAIDSDCGTMDDLKSLIDECHKRNVKIILDLVINHTSKNNKWFLNFIDAHKNKDINNPYYDFYTYCPYDNRPAGHSWHKIEGTDEFYEGNFSSDMPELNFDNEDVKKAVVDIAKYYLDMGIDGFRFDAAKYIYFNDTEKSVKFWDWYIKQLKDIKPDIYTVGEVWSGDSETFEYIKELNCFNFTLANAEGKISETSKNGNVNLYTKYIETYQNKILSLNEEAMIIPFISNHDMDRSAGFLMMLSKLPYIAANLLLLSPGSPFIYYGEEIAMKGSRGGANTDANRRLAMLWGDNDMVKNPQGSSFDSKKQINGTVKEQINNEDSLFNHYRKLIQLRNKYKEIARGNYKAYTGSNNDMGGFIITYENEVTGLFHNTSSVDELSIDLSEYNFSKIVDYIGTSNIAKFENDILTLGPQTSAILK